jgi:hypothetical protein
MPSKLILFFRVMEAMCLKRMGSELPYDQKFTLPQPIYWRPVDESSVHKDEVIVIIPDAEEVTAAEFVHELKPLIYAMKIFVLFPLKKRGPGQSSFRII